MAFVDPKQIAADVEALQKAKTHLERTSSMRALVVASELGAMEESKEISPIIQAGALPILLDFVDEILQHNNDAQPALASLHVAYQSVVIFSNLLGDLNSAALVAAGVFTRLINCIDKVDSSLDIIVRDGEDESLLTDKDKVILKIRSKAIEALANILESNPQTTNFVDAGGLPTLLNFIFYARPSEDRKEAIRALLYISENAIVREEILKVYTAEFPATPFAHFQAKIFKAPSDRDEKTLLLDILRNLDILTDYIKPGKVFYDVHDFSFIKLLEDNYAVIRKEFEQLQQHHLVSWPEKYLCKKGWDVFGLYAFKNQFPENCQQCPETAKILQQIPGMTTAMFSCIQPRTHIRPHVGYYQYSNRILRCHLGLIIPTDGETALKVNGTVQNWEQGKCFVFDDTFRHEAYNKSKTTTRVVLMIDFDFEGDPSLRNPDFYLGSDPKHVPESSSTDSTALISPDLLAAIMNMKPDPENVKPRSPTASNQPAANAPVSSSTQHL